jgi:hypothetical protein
MAGREYSNKDNKKGNTQRYLPVKVVSRKTGKKQVGKTAVLDMNNRIYDAAIKDSTLEKRGPYGKHSDRIIRQTRKANKIKQSRKK